MSRPYRVLGICGSIRVGAFSKAVLTALAEAMKSEAQFDFADIASLPHFNQDHFVDPLPPAVGDFRAQIVRSQGIVICSPEYNHGMPGVLKNALDWASRPHNASPLKDKPALVISSSAAFTGGVRAQYQIRETLVAVLARPVSTPEIVIGTVAAKIIDGHFADAASIAFARSAMDKMFDEIAMISRAGEL